MLREAAGIKRILVACGRTDLRRGIDGLAALVRLSYGMDPLEEGTLFLFCGVKKDRIKGLLFEGIGFCLFTLRLSDGRFQWPNTPDEARDITVEQYRRLLDGFAVDSTIRRYVRKGSENQ
jgi:transposase